MLRLIAIGALLNVGLLALGIPRQAGLGPPWLALEALALAGLFSLLPKRRARLPAWLAGIAIALLTLLALGDALARMSLNRALNLYLDGPHIASIYRLIAGNVSLPLAILGSVALLLCLAGLATAVAWLLGRLAGARTRPVRALALVLLVTGLVGVIGGHGAPRPPHAGTPARTLVADQIHSGLRMHADQQDFRAMLAETSDRPRTLDGLEGVDVILGLLESYGVSAIFDRRYARQVRPSLEALGAAVEARDLHMVSGTINAPIFGGQSWLAHASLLTGLWIDSHLRYERMLDSDRHNLVEELGRTGHHTVALQPANTRPWPEGAWYGYDRSLNAAELDYQGPPFNWVTMPDQYVWSHFQAKIRAPLDRPVFAKLALISGHAPWVPVLPVIEDWDKIGDGSIFDQWQGRGESPESLWRDPDRVREHYARSVAYAIQVASAYAERYTDDRTLLILMGDHQPAPVITGPGASPAVPVHVISGDPELLAPFRQYGFVDGALPTDEFTRHSMDELRQWLHDGFGDGG